MWSTLACTCVRKLLYEYIKLQCDFLCVLAGFPVSDITDVAFVTFHPGVTNVSIHLVSHMQRFSPRPLNSLWCVKSLEGPFKSQSSLRLFQDSFDIMHPLVNEAQFWTNWAIKLTSLPAVQSPEVCATKRKSVPNVRVSFRLCYQWFHEAHLCFLAAPPSTSTSTCTLTHASHQG